MLLVIGIFISVSIFGDYLVGLMLIVMMVGYVIGFMVLFILFGIGNGFVYKMILLIFEVCSYLL